MKNEEVKLEESTWVADVRKVTWAGMVRNTSNQQENVKDKQNQEKKEYQDNTHSFLQNPSILVE